MSTVNVNLLHADEGYARTFTFSGHADARLIDAEIRALKNILRRLMSHSVDGEMERFEVAADKVVVYRNASSDGWIKVGSEVEPRIRAILTRSMKALGHANVKVE